MTWTYDPDVGSPRDQVRMLIGDTDQDDPDNHYFSNEELDAMLTMEGNSVKLAAAQALETMGRQEVMILKVIKILDLQTDGAAVGRELRFQAKELREQTYGGDDNLPDWAEMVLDGHTLEERLFKEAQRND